MEDETIIALFFAREQSAISAAQDAYGSYCFSIANQILHSREDAEECVSDTMWRAWNAIPPNRPERLRLFLGKITRNLAFDRYRRMRAEKRGGGEMDAILEELSEVIPAEDNVEEDFDRRELSRCISSFLREQPQRERHAEPVKDIARAFGLSANHTSVLLRRTRAKLVVYLKKEGYQHEA